MNNFNILLITIPSNSNYSTYTLLPDWDGKMRYKQYNGFLLAENVRKMFIFASIAWSNRVVTVSQDSPIFPS